MKRIEHKFINGIAYKRCCCCKKYLIFKEFNTDNSRADGLCPKCSKCRIDYYQSNKVSILTKNKAYHQKNKEKRAKHYKKYRQSNKEKISEQNKKHINSFAKYNTYAKQLLFVEEVSGDLNGNLLVLCVYCGKKYAPTNLEVIHRIKALNTADIGENRFYCSENCKTACPTFGQRKYPKGFKKATSREVVPLLRQLVLERDDYTCQKCGATTETTQLHVHHEKSYTLNKIMANDPDNCITLCKECHKQVHSQKGCRNIDLQCQEDTKNG
jgi:5-methylcytosine-specific restriction endonuclease McrA